MARSSSKLKFYLPGIIILSLIVLGVLGYAGFLTFQDWKARGPALEAARARFVPIRAAMTKRLAQQRPLEFGQVWVTHSGRICGLVNGEGAFEGHPGMTPFYSDGRPSYSVDEFGTPQVDGIAVHYALDGQPEQFAGQWTNCDDEVWGVLVPGSIDEGLCATKAAPASCKGRKD